MAMSNMSANLTMAATQKAGPRGTKPKEGYICRWCGTQGGQPGAHWHQECSENPANGGKHQPPPFMPRLAAGSKAPPGQGYTCKWCKQPGGEPNSHWHIDCPQK